jgi:hypothetical protein
MSNLKLPSIYDFAQAERVLGIHDERKLGYETRLVRIDDDTIGVKHFNTVILQFTRDNLTVYTTPDRWHTRTTIHRLHHFSPPGVHVGTQRGVTYVTAPDRAGIPGIKVPLSEGLKVHTLHSTFVSGRIA